MDQYINRKSVLKFKASLKKTFNSKTSKLQGFIVLFYILVVFVGLVSRLDETYYQSKNNVFNKIFAKNGWFWNTVVYGAYLAINENERQGEKLVFSILRYIVATGYWYIITQKTFFGPSVFDMIFTMSGGNCRFNEDTESFSNYGKTNDINSSYQCKQLKGEWINGHDASGHCFLLVHSSLFLLEEICGSLNKKKILELNKFNFFKKIFFGLLILWVNMLFFTVTYFHNMKESSTGLIFGILYWFLIYFLLLPKLQKLFNVPLLPYEIEHENNDIKNENENENENESESESESDKEEKKWEFRKERGIWLNIYYYTLNIGYHTLDLIIKAGILFSERISMLIY